MMWNWLASGIGCGATLVLYEGSPFAPLSVLWDFAQEERINVFAGSPKRLPPKFEIEGLVVANLRRQLATVMGKTHMVEFAFGGTGQNAHYGSPRNTRPHIDRPAVHRGGAGVSLCEGSALLAFGSDTAASVRLPAAMTGNAGLKLTKGRWWSEGLVPLSFTFDTPGILARTMADAGFSFAALDPYLGGAFAGAQLLRG